MRQQLVRLRAVIVSQTCVLLAILAAACEGDKTDGSADAAGASDAAPMDVMGPDAGPPSCPPGEVMMVKVAAGIDIYLAMMTIHDDGSCELEGTNGTPADATLKFDDRLDETEQEFRIWSLNDWTFDSVGNCVAHATEPYVVCGAAVPAVFAIRNMVNARVVAVTATLDHAARSIAVDIE